MILNHDDKLWTLSRNSERLLYNGSLYFPAQGLFLALRPCPWILAPDPGPGLQFVFTVAGPKFAFATPGPQFVLTAPSPQFLFTEPNRNFAFTGPGS